MRTINSVPVYPDSKLDIYIYVGNNDLLRFVLLSGDKSDSICSLCLKYLGIHSLAHSSLTDQYRLKNAITGELGNQKTEWSGIFYLFSSCFIIFLVFFLLYLEKNWLMFPHSLSWFSNSPNQGIYNSLTHTSPALICHRSGNEGERKRRKGFIQMLPL